MPVLETIRGWPPGVQACVSLRGHEGQGQSQRPFDFFNLGDHVGDDPHIVWRHRQELAREICAQPVWLQQVHGADVVYLSHHEAIPSSPIVADASFTARPGLACAVLVADCMPILVSRQDGGLVGVSHAGWRGLCQGVIPNLLSAMVQHDPIKGHLGFQVWLGPCIGPLAFEVGPEVFAAFQAAFSVYHIDLAMFFRQGRADRYWADLPGLAQAQCVAWSNTRKIPIGPIMQDGRCTVKRADQFYSYRRDGTTGRMAALIWRKTDESSQEFI